MTTQNILVTGPTGHIASLVLPQLKDKGANVRIFLHNEGKANDYKSQGYDVVVGDFANKASIEKAIAGMDSVFLVTPPHADASTWAQTFLDVAKHNPSLRIVRLSALRASTEGPTNNTKLHGQTDNAIQGLNNPWCILRPHYFMQNLFGAGEGIAKEGKLFQGVGEGRLGMIDARDVADCAVTCLLDRQWDYGCYTLTGPASLNMHEVANTFSSVLGKEVTYAALTPAAVEDSMQKMGMGGWTGTMMRQYCEAFTQGWGNFTTNGVQKMTGHAPRSFEQFCREVYLPATKR